MVYKVAHTRVFLIGQIPWLIISYFHSELSTRINLLHFNSFRVFRVCMVTFDLRRGFYQLGMPTSAKIPLALLAPCRSLQAHGYKRCYPYQRWTMMAAVGCFISEAVTGMVVRQNAVSVEPTSLFVCCSASSGRNW